MFFLTGKAGQRNYRVRSISGWCLFQAGENPLAILDLRWHRLTLGQRPVLPNISFIGQALTGAFCLNLGPYCELIEVKTLC